MKRKGNVQLVVLVLIAVIMALVLADLGFKNVKATGDIIRSESLEIVAGRVESAFFALDALENAKIEMNLEREGYNVYTEDGNKFIEFNGTFKGSKHKLENPSGISYTVYGDPDGEKVKKLCLVKNSTGLILKPGEC